MISADAMIRFAESGNQQRLTTLAGQRLQGWIMEVDETRVVISVGAGEKGQDIAVALADVRPESLEYWDTRAQAWCRFDAGQA